MSRLQMYVAGSVVLANVVFLRAYYERPNFYSAAVYISQSTGSLLFLLNLALIVTASIGYGLQRLFYGPLRAIETEQLYDKAWFAVSETLLAMTIFRDDIGIWFFAMFLCLLAGKVWQWIGEGRVELLEQQPPANPRLFHARLISSLLISVAFDIFMVNYCIDRVLVEARPGVMVMFGFEYVLLAIASASTLVRYTLSIVEMVVIHQQEKARLEARRIAREQAQQRAAAAEEAPEATADDDDDDDGDVPGWEEKGRWIFGLDILTDFVKSVVYVGFFLILMAFYGIPIHIMRDLFITLRSFIMRLKDFVKYRNATRDMNTRYPDATAEELERENTCIVCREEMRPWIPPNEAQPGRRVDERNRPKKLPCGHILHLHCLRSWLERQQVCPTCRRPVLAEATPQNGTANNQANQGQQNQNGPDHLGLGNIFGGNQQNQAHPPAGQPDQPGQAQQPNRPAANMRVFNFGPIRIALGQLRVPDPQQQPAHQQGNGNNVANNNQNIINLVQQHLLQNQQQNQNQGQDPVQGQNQNQPHPQHQATSQLPHNVSGTPASVPSTADIQSDILRIQQNIVDSIQVLNIHHHQLERINAILTELRSVQQAMGVNTNGQELPYIAPLNSSNLGHQPITPTAYLANGSVLRTGDAQLPAGLILPEGYTLRPLMRATPQVETPRVPEVPVAGPAAAAGATATSSLPFNPSNLSSILNPAPTPTQNQGSSVTPASPVQPQQDRSPFSPSRPQIQQETSSSSVLSELPDSVTTERPAVSSVDSSWSFGDVGTGGPTEDSGSSTAVAVGSRDDRDVTRRTATVEDAEDVE